MNIKRRLVKQSLKVTACILVLIVLGVCGGYEVGNYDTKEWFHLVSIFSVLGLDAAWLSWKL